MVSEPRLTEGLIAYDNDEYELAYQCLAPYEDCGPPRAQFLLGMMYSNGLGTDQNEERGQVLVKAAADSGDLDAAFVFGYDLVMSSFSGNVPLGIQYLQQAADLNHPQAMHEMGWLFLESGGSDVTKDHEKAFNYFYNSAERHPGSAHGLAYMYLSGRGAEKNPVEAYAWALAASRFIDVQHVVSEAEALLDAADRKKGDQLAKIRLKALTNALEQARARSGHGLNQPVQR